MIYVKVVFANGDSLQTGINATLEEARAYYLGKPFNLGRMSGYYDDAGKWIEAEEDDWQAAVSCELLTDEDMRQ